MSTDHEQSEARDQITASLEAQATLHERVAVESRFTIECYSADGRLLWREVTVNPSVAEA